MAYEQHEWVNGETITAAKMNNIEEGIAEAAQSGGGGYDAEVKIYHDNNSSHEYELTIVSGNFADLAAKTQNNETPVILFRIWDELAGIFTTTTNAVQYGRELDISVPYIIWHIYPIINMANNSTATTQAYLYFVWNAENEVYFD